MHWKWIKLTQINGNKFSISVFSTRLSEERERECCCCCCCFVFAFDCLVGCFLCCFVLIWFLRLEVGRKMKGSSAWSLKAFYANRRINCNISGYDHMVKKPCDGHYCHFIFGQSKGNTVERGWHSCWQRIYIVILVVIALSWRYWIDRC